MSTAATQVKKVLFVDDNLQFLEMIERLMGHWSQGEWQIFTALNAGKALLILQEHNIDLAVVDVQMPVVDGIQFLALLNRKYPAMQKVTLSAYGDDAARAACLSHGAELFFEKPRDPADLEIIFSTLRELARHPSTTTGFRGVMRTVNLQDVIQMECLNRNSSILEVKTLRWKGDIYIKEGMIIHAEAGERNGETALNHILSLKGGEFNLRPYAEPERQTIDGQWEFLLMEAARASDEAAQKQTDEMEDDGIPDSALPPMPKPAPVIKPPTKIVAPQKPAGQSASAFVSEKPVQAAPVAPEPPFTAVTPSFTPRPQLQPQPLPKPKAQPPASSKPVPQAVEPSAQGQVRIDEMLICSARGEVLYDHQCPNPSDRVSFLEFLSRNAAQLGDGLNLGAFDRIEMESPTSRIIAQVKKDRGIFIQTVRQADSQ